MGNNNNNLDNFLRGKFSDIENSEEAWTRPSLNVKNNILAQITEPPQKKRKRALFLLLFLLGALASFGLYESCKSKKDVHRAPFDVQERNTNAKEDTILVDNNSNYLAKNLAESNSETINRVPRFSKDELLERNALLKKVIQNQNDIITQLQKENLKAQSNSVEDKLTKERLNDDQSKDQFKGLLAMNSRLEIEQNRLKFLNKTQEEEIDQLKNEKQLLLDRLKKQAAVANSKREREDIESIKNVIAFEEVKPLVATELEGKDLLVEPVKLEENFGLDQPKKKIEFEVGYQLGLRGKMTEIIDYAEEQGTITNQVKDKLLVSHVHGLNIGISPIKNFWIKTGAHVGNMNLHQKHNVKFTYNSNNQLTFSPQAYTNEINNLSRAGISTLQENVELLDDAQYIQNGDLVDLDFQTNLVLTYLQIPLEFNYQYGKKRLQALFQLGGTWNLLNYQYYMHGFETIQNNQSRTYLSDHNNSESKDASVSYWGLHAGLGLSYNISKHLVFQGLCSYEYSFQEYPIGQGMTYNTQYVGQPTQTTPKTAGISSSMGFGVKLGLNYRF